MTGLINILIFNESEFWEAELRYFNIAQLFLEVRREKNSTFWHMKPITERGYSLNHTKRKEGLLLEEE